LQGNPNRRQRQDEETGAGEQKCPEEKQKRREPMAAGKEEENAWEKAEERLVPHNVDAARRQVEEGEEDPWQEALQQPAPACKEHVVPRPSAVDVHLRAVAGSGF